MSSLQDKQYCFYNEKLLVIEYVDKNKRLSKTTTNMKADVIHLPELITIDSDDDEETIDLKYKEELKNVIIKNRYKKMIFENGSWVKSSYEKRYKKDLNYLCPNLDSLVRIYKESRCCEW